MWTRGLGFKVSLLLWSRHSLSVTSRLCVVKLGTHFKVLKEWKFNPTAEFRGGIYGGWIGLGKIVKVESSCLNPRARRGKRAESYSTSLCSFPGHVTPGAVSGLPIRKSPPDMKPWPLFFKVYCVCSIALLARKWTNKILFLLKIIEKYCLKINFN